MKFGYGGGGRGGGQSPLGPLLGYTTGLITFPISKHCIYT